MPDARQLAVVLVISYGLSHPVLCLDLGLSSDPTGLLASQHVASSTAPHHHGASAADQAGGHQAHRRASRADGASPGTQAGHDALQLSAPCPCGCGDTPNVAASRARVGDAVKTTLASAPVSSLTHEPHIVDAVAQAARVSPIDHVPIPA